MTFTFTSLLRRIRNNNTYPTALQKSRSKYVPRSTFRKWCDSPGTGWNDKLVTSNSTREAPYSAVEVRTGMSGRGDVVGCKGGRREGVIGTLHLSGRFPVCCRFQTGALYRATSRRRARTRSARCNKRPCNAATRAMLPCNMQCRRRRRCRLQCCCAVRMRFAGDSFAIWLRFGRVSDAFRP